LRALGFECTHVGEIGMWKATDRAILDTAVAQAAIVVTIDADFHAILAVSSASGPSVVRLRLEGLGAAEVATLVLKVLARFEADLKRGSLVTVKKNRITCHRLPIGRGD
jgi:predicted nuclease of predicted toxin-antitoxin system